MTTLTTVNVTISLRRVVNQPLQGGWAEFTLTRQDYDGPVTVPVTTETVALPADGSDVVVALWPNTRGTQGSQYQVMLKDQAGAVHVSGLATIQADCSLSAVLYTSAPPAVPVYPATSPAAGQILVGGAAGTYTPKTIGANKQVLFNDAGSPAADSGLTYDKTTGVLMIGGKTLAASAPSLNVAQTWGAAAVLFTAALVNVTDQASAAASLLQDWQIGGVSKASIDKAGNVTAAGSILGTSVGAGVTNLAYSFQSLGGGMRAQALASPAAPTVTPTGVAGTTACTYYVVAKDRFGNKTIASVAGTTATGNAVLSGANYNALAWAAVPGAASYDVLKGDTAHSIAVGITATTFNDTGIATSAYTAPTRNATADLTVDGALFLRSGWSYMEADSVNVWGLKNGAASQWLRIYNTTDGTNSEFLSLRFSANTALIGAEQIAGGATRNTQLGTSTGASTIVYGYDNQFWTGGSMRWSVGNAGHLDPAADLTYGIGNGSRPSFVRAGSFIASSAAGTVTLVPDANNVLALRTGASAQTFNIYNAFTDVADYSRLSLTLAGGVRAVIRTEGAGTGAACHLDVQAGVGASVNFGAGGTTNQWQVNGSNGNFLAVTDNANSIGSSSGGRPNTVFAGTSLQAPRIVTTALTVATLPGISTPGARAFVTDSTVAGSGNFGAVVAGGGTNGVPVYQDGTNWRIG